MKVGNLQKLLENRGMAAFIRTFYEDHGLVVSSGIDVSDLSFHHFGTATNHAINNKLFLLNTTIVFNIENSYIYNKKVFVYDIDFYDSVLREYWRSHPCEVENTLKILHPNDWHLISPVLNFIVETYVKIMDCEIEASSDCRQGGKIEASRHIWTATATEEQKNRG